MIKTYFIYQHISPSGKVYVGQTINIRSRWGTNGEHYRTKKEDGSYIQPSFARAIDKYGWKNFKHEILLEGISKSHADYAERYLIRWYQMHNQSYNIAAGGEGCDTPRPPLSEEQRRKISERLLKNHPMRGKHWSPETLAKITKANRDRTYTQEQREAMAEKARKLFKGRFPTPEVRKKLSDYRKAHPETWVGGWNKREVHQYDCTGNYIASYSSAMEAAESIGKNVSGKIADCCRGKISSAGGFIWKFEKMDFIDVSNYKIVYTARGARVINLSENSRLRRSAAHGHAVNQYSLDGKYITTYCTASEASRKTGINYSGINRCCRHVCGFKTSGGFKWEFDNGSNRNDLIMEGVA